MNTINVTNKMEDVKINVKMKLSALWVALMLIYIYALYSLIYNLTKLISCPPYRRQDQNCTPYMAVFDKDALSVLQYKFHS